MGVTNVSARERGAYTARQQPGSIISSPDRKEPQESEEIKPAWFQKADIPYEKMWDDAQYWLPRLLTGQSIEGEFVFDQTLKVAHYTITGDAMGEQLLKLKLDGEDKLML